jgi:hypothetical protein
VHALLAYRSGHDLHRALRIVARSTIEPNRQSWEHFYAELAGSRFKLFDNVHRRTILDDLGFQF